MSALSEYRRSVLSAREWFAHAHTAAEESFDLVNSGFDALGQILRRGRDRDNAAHASLAPLLFIAQRQAMVAMDSLASRQAYQSLLLVRPGIEAGLMMGKWAEDVRNYTIWDKRLGNPKEYSQAYSGTALRSTALSRPDRIQVALKTINDLFAHPNPQCYMRHTSVTSLRERGVQLELRSFDNDEFHSASLLGVLHLLIVLQDSIARMFQPMFMNVEVHPEVFGLEGFQQRNREEARAVARTGVGTRDSGEGRHGAHPESTRRRPPHLIWPISTESDVNCVRSQSEAMWTSRELSQS